MLLHVPVYRENTYIEVLDSTRIHPETYVWARKMAVDALEYDEVRHQYVCVCVCVQCVCGGGGAMCTVHVSMMSSSPSPIGRPLVGR